MNNALSRQPWRDDDAIAQPGQSLSQQELAHLVALANGNAPSVITAIHGTSRLQQQQLESSLRAKLGASSKAHLITRAFVLQVLLPRCLCALLAISLLATATHNDTLTPRPARPSASVARLVRHHRHGGRA